MKRSARIGIYVLAGLIAGLVIGTMVVLTLSRTQFGQERVRRLALGWLDEQVEGEVHIGSLGGRGLLGGLTLNDFYIIDPKGRPFLSADSAVVAYNWRTFVSGRIVIDRATLYHPRIFIEQLPGDSIWNYQHVFPPREKPGGPSGPRRLIMFNNARIVNGLAVVRVPLEPTEDVDVADTARAVVEEVPGGLAKVLRFDSIQGLFSRVVWESPIEKGRLVDVRSMTARGYVWRDPLHLTGMRGTVTVRDTILTFDMPDVRLPNSQAAIVGRVIMEEGNNFFDVRAEGKRFTFRDMQWLYPQLPDEGGGSGTLRIQSQRPKGILWLASNLRVAAPGTRMSGSFGVVTGDTLYFTDVDLRAAPLNLDLIQAILPGKLPVDGLLIGTVEVKGPLSSLQTSGNMHLAQNGERSSVKWRGTFDVRNGINARNLRADLNRLDLAILNALRPDLRLRGHVTGRVEASGNMSRSMSFAADIHHYLAGYTSSFDGGGVYNATGPNAGLDLRLNAQPLSFQELAEAYPALERLRGEARGPIRLYGALDDLQLDAELQTAAGLARINGRLQRNGGHPRYSGVATISDFQLDQLIDRLPTTTISGKVGFDVGGADIRSAAGSITAQLSSGRISAVDFRGAQTAMMLERGALRVDSLSAQTQLGDLTARGRISLLDERIDTLSFNLQSDSVPFGSWGGRLRANGSLIGARGQFAGQVSALATPRDTSNQFGAQALFEAREGGMYFRFDELRVGSRATPWTLERSAHISVNDHGLTADTLIIRRDGGGSALLIGRVAWHGRSHPSEAENVSDFAVEFKGVPFADFAQLKFAHMETTGSVDGNLQITGNSAAPIIQGKAVVRQPAIGDAELDSVVASFGYSDRQISTRLDALEQGRRIFYADGAIPIDLSFLPVRERRLNQQLTFTLTADSAPATLLTGFVGGLQDVHGYINGSLTAGGTPRDVRLGGELVLRAGDAFYQATGVRYRDVNGRFTLADNREAIVEATLRANGGQARVQGKLGFMTASDPTFDLDIEAQNFLAANRKDAEFTATGTVKLGGRYRQPIVMGAISVGDGSLYLDELYRRYQIVELDNPLLYDVVDTTIVALQSFLPPSQNPFVKNLIIRDLRVEVGRESWLRSRDLNVELTGDLNITFLDNDPAVSQRSADELRLLGTLRAVRGTYTLYSIGTARQFSIREGTIEFPGTPGVDPNLGINAAYRARPSQGDPIDIIAVVGGTLRSPRVRLTSDEEPPISESDLASYLFFGVPTYALSPSQNAAVAPIGGLNPEVMGFAGLGVRALTSSGFGYLASGLQTFAQNYGILDYVGLTAAEGAGAQQQNAIAGLFAGTRLELGRYIGDEVYLAASQRLASGGTPGVRLEWRFLPTLTAEFFSEDRFARNPSFGIENSDSKRVWGFLLFKEWSY
ncbi:MAG TPA: translocation/assembly module TamB [Longimicrobiales bacterium]